MYLEKRRRRWYAIHEIPEDVREAIGRGKQFFKGLETEDKFIAKRRAALLEVEWLSLIEQARRGTRDHVERDAAYWRKVLKETPEEFREMTLDYIGDETQARVERAMERAGFTDYHQDGWQDLPEVEAAYRFNAIATGRLVKFDEHLDEWLATLSNEAKTKDMKKSTVLKFVEEFAYVQDVKAKDVQRWVNRLVADEGKKAKTIQRILSELRGYWSYLISIEVISRDHLPFEKLTLPQEGKRTAGSESWVPFTPADVVALLRAAEAKGDTQLADLIRLGMWTGGRIESLCALRVEEVREDSFDILHDKSQAGRRTVPIHSKLKTTMDRLIRDAGKDGFLLPGLSMNKYGDRSDAIGKRFGRLKTDLKFGPQHVFHSIRKTVATLLENAGVPENVAADIIGHDKPTMTYGLYSGGASLEVKREALERIDYPGYG
ncbi:tyrosine-type recombinase/integrase [Magnetospirillum fulvum]|uniref:Integrase n=1 Tax=Magnetospirillum fulvum MGU-K5 TaxID=1316936 RepID=S9SAB8_MAGFU|nr:tyrosine-type recombinase/integrase [Magnetospirillum fulvum]EPY01624.1 integrase [Magnetospirillum fulvum MGU-K5]